MLLIIHFMGALLFKSKEITLYCGLFGWFGKTPSKFNKDKFDKLGIYNEERGTHSCGVSIDGEIKVGIDDLKLYKDFIVGRNDVPKKYPTVIGHTRKASYGKHTIDNAHPFGFGTNKNKEFEFVGAHNGTLLNHKELAKKYNINIDVVNKKKKFERSKIDSEVLLEILYKSKNFKVLSEYNGAAALIFTNTNHPNIVYCFRGISKTSRHSTSLQEERPLFYYKEGKNSLYVSSMKKSLEAIGGDEKSIDSFKPNILYKIVDGDISKATKIKISRKDRFQKEYGNYGYDYYNYDKEYEEDKYFEKDTKETSYKQILSHNNNNEINIHKEKIEQNKYKGKVYFHKLRYLRNGHPINGIYTWVPKFGFYYLGDQLKHAEEVFWGLTNTYFLNGEFLPNNPSRSQIEKGAFVPFLHNIGKKEIIYPALFFFYKGIRLRTFSDYNQSISFDNTKNEFTINQLSCCSTHPVVDISRFKGYKNQCIIFENMLANATISPLGSEKIYTIEEGNCVDMKDAYKTKDKNIESLKSIEEDIKKQTSLRIVEDDKENDLVEADIEEMFHKNFRDFPRYIERLKKYKNSDKAKHAIEIMDEYIKSTTALVAIEPNE